MERTQRRRVRCSAHHGDLAHPNELDWAKRVCRQYDEVDCLEIDFVTFRGQVLSSHDYDEETIARGSPLHDWLRFCAQRGLQLWIDVKQNLALYMNCMYGHFDVTLFFDALSESRDQLLLSEGVDVRQLVWIGCQEPLLLQQLNDCNHKERRHDRWSIVLDLPHITAYVCQALVPSLLASYTTRYAERAITQDSEARHYSVLSLDQSFWPTLEDLVSFVRSLKLASGTTVILNSYARGVKAPRIQGLNIVMQYDYEAK